MSRRKRNASALTTAGMLAVLGIVPGAPLSRSSIESAIERLVAVLDEMDGDSDLEPSLSFDVRPYPDESEEDEDFEPSLGWSTTMATSRYDSAPMTIDLEDWYSEVAR